MKYYLIAGEASGDLHAANLMRELRLADSGAQFRFFGGDMMKREGGTLVKHYKELAYMGFVPVLLHLRTIFANMKMCKNDIMQYRPDVVILVDYPGFNLSIAEYVATHSDIPVYYYISPKIWAWKEYRIKKIKKYIREMYSILPFEVEFYKGHDYNIHYVGNPTVEEVIHFKKEYGEDREDFVTRHSLSGKPVIAVLAGSRKQEIKDNLPKMLEAVKQFPDYQAVIAGAPGIAPEYYSQYLAGNDTRIIFGETYQILEHADAALVTSGTATLETALFNVPQVVCYYLAAGKLMSFLKRTVLKVKYISLVNLIAGKEVVQELVADRMTVDNVVAELRRLTSDKDYRNRMLTEYRYMAERLGTGSAAGNAAREIVDSLK